MIFLGVAVWLAYQAGRQHATSQPIQQPHQIPQGGCVYITDLCHWPQRDGWSVEMDNEWMRVYVRCGAMKLMDSRHVSQGVPFDYEGANRVFLGLKGRCGPNTH